MRKHEIRFGMGNEAIAEGAIAAGARFYAGYPITPSSEIADISSVRLPQVGGIFVQMEDEIGSMSAIIGASAAGVKSYTATSGPGISLMQENIGVAVITEIPCVIINVQRSGPSTGLATKPGQQDVMQARWGAHGDHAIIALSPSSVQECYDLTIRAFNLAEKYRTPVCILSDEIVGHMREQFELHGAKEIIGRKQPDPSMPVEAFRPYDFERYEDHIAPLPPFGGRYVYRHTASGHDENGYVTNDKQNANKFIRHYTEKIEKHRDDIVTVEAHCMEDAEYAIISFGCSVRSAMAAMRMARARGKKVGVLKLITLWPFADKEVRAVLDRVKGAIVAEMNLGQVFSEVSRHNDRRIPLVSVGKVDAEIIYPEEILDALEEAARA
ncbi:MAG: 2-oxoacid:acceptor oxidoreductase subunit alpha [Clostridiales Family XIII bacterium]|jgi:2-oxoglutarate ferredoxin oxidoreductase subunit alpha|nr:2-oxoacid:acceptor oxidoreductase subunit alpha [Clostridiales Family XIII bacterium]